MTGGNWLNFVRLLGLAFSAVAANVLPVRRDGDPESKDEAGPQDSTAMTTVDVPVKRPGDRASDAGEWAGELLGKGVRAIISGKDSMRRRYESLRGIYRLLREMGMSDAEIAKLVATQGREFLGQELSERTLTAAEINRALDNLNYTVLKAITEVDDRLNLDGELIERAQLSLATTRRGRTQAAAHLETAYAAVRSRLLKLLEKPDRFEDEDFTDVGVTDEGEVKTTSR